MDLDRFTSKIDIRGLDDCWEWMAGRDPQGYGKFSLNGECVIGQVVEMEGEGLIVGDKRYAPHEIASIVFTFHKEDWQA